MERQRPTLGCHMPVGPARIHHQPVPPFPGLFQSPPGAVGNAVRITRHNGSVHIKENKFPFIHRVSPAGILPRSQPNVKRLPKDDGQQAASRYPKSRI